MTITGTAIDRQSSNPVANQRVELWAGDGRMRRVSRTTTDAAGKFQLSYEEPTVADGQSRVALKVFLDGKLLDIVEGTGEWTLGQEPDGDLQVRVAPSTGERVLSGKVGHTDGTAVKGVTVTAYHLSFGGDSALASATTDGEGRYEIRYQRAEGAPDLFARAFSNGNKTALATSHVIYAALPRERIDLTVTDARYRGPSEFASVDEALAPLLGSTDLGTLNTEDVAVLVEKTGLQRDHVGRYVVARRIATKTKLSPEAVYGLLRSGASPSLARHISQPAPTVKRLLTRAAESNVVSLELGKQADKVSARMKTALVDQAVRSTSPRSLGKLLATAGLDQAKQRDFANRYLGGRDDLRQFWTGLRRDPAWGDVAVDRVQLSLQLGLITVNHPPLVKALLQRPIRSARDTVTLRREDWLALLDTEVDGTKIGVPKGVLGASDDEKRATYAGILTRQVELAFPTAAVADAMKQENASENRDVITFLDLNPTFEFGTTQVGTFLAAPGTRLDGISDTTSLSGSLSVYQRVFKIAPETGKYTTMSTLVSAGLDSALSVQRLARDAFVSAYGKSLGEVEAQTVYGNAVAQASAALSMLTVHGAAFQGPALASVQQLSEPTPEQISVIPDYRTLFGSIDFCQCEHCRSVLSPAAYLVDLLAWLDTVAPGSVDTLLARRPDIGTMELSCDNTNIALPYVDLVNEILENGVALLENAKTPLPAPPFEILTHDATTVQAAELLANPEYFNSRVYDEVLSTASYPFNLPFHLANTQARVFLKQLGVERWDLMETFQRDDDPGDDEIATEYLALSTDERELITGTAGHEQWELWGYSAETGLDDPRDGGGKVGYRKALAYVPEFLRRSGLEYKDLLDLLHTDFVNAEGDLGIVSTGETSCNLDEMELQHSDGTVPTAQELGRMRRFIRLWRALDWTMFELDKVLISLDGAEDLADLTVRKIAEIRRIREQVKIDLLPLLTWWAAIDLKKDREGADPEAVPLYDRVFLNHAVITDPDNWPFYLNADRSALADESKTLAQSDSELQAALGVDAEDLADAEARVAYDLGTTIDALTVNLDVLTRLYRIVSLAKTLGLSVADALAYQDLIGLDPFAGPENGRAFVEEVAEIRAAGFSIDDLLYLLRHDEEAALEVAPSEDALAVTLAGIRSGLQQIRDETVVEPDPTGEITRQRLTEIVAEEDLDRLMLVIAGESIELAADQEALIDEHLAAFLDPAAAKTMLITGDPASPAAEARYAYVLAALVPYLAELDSEALIKEKIAGALELELAAAEDLLVNRVTSGGEPALAVFLAESFINGVAATAGEEATSGVDGDLNPTDQAAAFSTLNLLHKIADVLKKFEIDTSEQVWLFEHRAALGILDLTALPVEAGGTNASYADWKALADLIAARERLPGNAPKFIELLDILVDYDTTDPTAAGAARTEFLAELATRTNWSVDDLTYVADAFGFTAPEQLLDGTALLSVIDCFAILSRVGMPASQIDGWRAADLSIDPHATDIVMAVKSRYDVARWPEVARPRRDELREQQRAALVSYLVHAKGKEDANDLYAEYLIDVEMNPCMLTSRLKQAISSVQLFIQRCFLNLESGISLTAEDDERWKWMKIYRVWEANRKVFLYPENWIEPELRDDKTPFFRQLESELMQDEITDEKVETAYLGYLDKLLAVSRLEIVGLYHQEDTDDEDVVTDVLHVFGRTRGNPHSYYYRKWEDGAEWTAWEKLDLDVEGDHLIPVVHERRLMLFWPAFLEQSDETRAWWSVQLAWSEYWEGKWSPKKMSGESLSLYDLSSEVRHDLTYTYLFKAMLDRGSLVVKMLHSEYGPDGPEGVELGTFTLNTCDGTIRAVPSGLDRPIVLPYYKSVSGMAIHDASYQDGEEVILTTGSIDAEKNLIDGTEDTNVVTLNKTTTNFVLSYAHQYDDFCSQDPFFLADDQRTYFVVPTETLTALSPTDFEADNTPVEDVGDYDDDTVVIADPAPPDTWDFSGIQFYEPEVPVWQEPIPDNGSSPRAARSVRPAVSARAAASATDINASSSQQTAALAKLKDTQKLLDSFAAYDTATFEQLDTVTKYTFYTFYHPYVCTLVRELRRNGVEGMLAPREEKEANQDDDPLARQKIHDRYFKGEYDPTEVVLEPYPKDNIDFNYGTAYSQYNWELFFHAPLLLAERLRRNQRFEEALRWFHFIFDPMNQNQKYEVPARYWKVKPFTKPVDAPIQELMALLPQESTDPDVIDEQESLRAEIEAWLDDPFDPHTIARLRPTAYQKTVVMKYLDNLIEWGDYLFRQDTIETINQATQLYILALEILGDKPEEIPPREEVENQSFNDIRGELDEFSNTLVEVENLLAAPSNPVGDGDGTLLGSVAYTLYFCVPLNEKLLGYWTTVEDRLFKIRHCMNIQGVVRKLPLFEPPIDPGLLVRAAAAGIDLSSAIADLNAPRPHYRFNVMLQKAQAFCATVRGLGAALLAALEKRDAEELAQLRQGHEVSVLKAAKEVRKQQLDEAKEQKTALERTLDTVTARRDYYQRLVEDGVSEKEQAQVDKLLAAKWLRFGAASAEAGAALEHGIPNLHVKPPNPAPEGETGGSFLGSAAEALAKAAVFTAAFLSDEAQLAAIKAGNQRRADEWEHQLDAAEKEIKQLDKQLVAADIRTAMAEKELANQELLIETSSEVDDWMRGKYTNRDLYDWMISQISSLYFQSYQLAYDLAKRAEKCYQHELAKPDAGFIQFGHWDSLKKGLLAGERLQYDLERCDASYVENDPREYEITKHISLAGLDPVALVALRQEGSCFFTMPEAIFDLDFPGHYLRRIKSVAVTVPCVAGPYSGVNCTLTLTKTSVRVDPTYDSGYPRTGDEDARFRDELGAESIVTSLGRNDTGLFETSMQDPRYLPFERRGAADSQWQISLSGALPQFDPQSVSDVILHVRYTAREGGSGLAATVSDGLTAQFAAMTTPSGRTGLMRLVSARHEFPDAWNAFLHPADTDIEHTLELELTEDRFPYPFHGLGIKITRMELFLQLTTTEDYQDLKLDVKAVGEDGSESSLEDDVPLQIDSSADPQWGGQPYGDAVLSEPPAGTFKLVANQDAILGLGDAYRTSVTVNETEYHHLNADVFVDLAVVIHYTNT